MTPVTDHPADTIWALLLTNRLTTVDAKPYSAGEFWKLVELLGLPRAPAVEPPHDGVERVGPSVESLDEIVERAGPSVESADEIVERAGLSGDEAERVRVLFDAGRAFGFERERLQDGGLRIVSAVDGRFPSQLRDRLGRNCPPFLIVAGDVDRLSAGGLAIAGSRDASDEALAVTREAAGAAVERRWPVITGLARGVDQAAVDAASAAGGDPVGVPAEGINVVSRRSHIRHLVHSGRLCIASPYGPDARFTAGTAMGRNKIIYALSTVGFVVSADKESGGTWTGAVESLRRQWCPVAAWSGDGAGDGNQPLVGRGARPITDVEELFGLEGTEPPPSLQATLF